jgi:hypothetical protein
VVFFDGYDYVLNREVFFGGHSKMTFCFQKKGGSIVQLKKSQMIKDSIPSKEGEQTQ